jgi:hypothetical protein
MKQAKRLCTGRAGRNSLLVDILKIFRSQVGHSLCQAAKLVGGNFNRIPTSH